MTTRETIAGLLRAFGIEIWPDQIRQLYGSRSPKSDVMGGWSAVGKFRGQRLEISSPYTMTACRKGIRLEANPDRWCLYGDVAAIPNDQPTSKAAKKWNHK